MAALECRAAALDAWRRLRQRDVVPYVFILPNLILFGVFVLGPVALLVRHELHELGRPRPATFTGLRNYAKLLTDDLFGTAVTKHVRLQLRDRPADDGDRAGAGDDARTPASAGEPSSG